jgi:DNA sulfur modification protein DndD
MLFQELVLENFGSYYGKNTIDLAPDSVGGRPIILVGGMNGGGKTTIVDALRLALYGSRAQCSTRGNLAYSDFLNQCINRQILPGEKTRIELLFKVAENGQESHLRIVRYWDYNPKDGKDTLCVIPNDGFNDSALVNMWDEYIENLLPLGISNLFLFDGEQVKELAEQETPPPAVFSAIESLLGLELSQRLATDLDVLVARKRKDLANTKQLEQIDIIEANLQQQEAKAIEFQQQLVHLDRELSAAKEVEEQAFNKYVQAGGQIAQVKTELQQQYKSIEQQIETSRQQLQIMAANELPLALIKPILLEVKERGIRETKYRYDRSTLNLLLARDRALLDYLESEPQLIKAIDKIQQFLDAQNQQLLADSNSADPHWLNADAEVLEQLDLILKTSIDRDPETVAAIDLQLDTMQQDLDNIDRQIASAAAPEEYERLRQQEKKARKVAIDLQVKIGEITIKQQELDRQIAKIKQDLTTYTETNLKLQNGQHTIDSIAKVKLTLQLFKEKLTLKKIDRLENEVTECFRYLLHKSELVQRVIIDSTTFSLTLYDRESKLLPKHRLSAGEKQLLAIALLWGLARVSGRQLPIAIDTPLGRLDSSHRSNLIERYFPSASEQVILLSTDTEIGINEVKKLRSLDAIAREYILEHNSFDRSTQIKSGYFSD